VAEEAPHLLPPAQTDPREKPHARAKRATVFHQVIPPECNGVCSKEGLDLCRGNSKSKCLGERRHRTTLQQLPAAPRSELQH